MSDPTASGTATSHIVRYHQKSKHHPSAFAPGPRGLDWANQPDPFLRYENAPRITLPLCGDGLHGRFGDLYTPGAIAPAPVTVNSVAALLEVSLGLAAWKSYGGNRWALRCNPSSGNLHPSEGYLLAPDIDGLAAGVYHYLSRDHELELRAQPATATWRDAWPAPGVILGLSSIPWREAWKYGVRAYRYCQHDAGHALAAWRYAAAALGWQARLLDNADDMVICELLGLHRDPDAHPAEHQLPELLAWVGPGPADPDTAALLDALGDATWHGRPNRLSRQHVRWPLIGLAEDAARKPATPGATRGHAQSRPPLSAAEGSPPATTLFRQRRSAVAFDGRTHIRRQTFFDMLDRLLPRPGVPPWDALPWAPRIHPVLFVHRVDDLEPGLYALARRPEVVPAMRAAMRPDWLWKPAPECPAHLELYLLLPMDMQSTAQIISCHQEIAADSAFSLGMLAEFEDSLHQGAWWYRYLHLEAGILGHTLYLESEAAGLRATGIGCFLDDEMHRLLGLRNAKFQTLYHFTVGGPVEDSRLTTHEAYAHLETAERRCE